ncbi:MAG: FKBP-type peptidyl-prolyl cis-trans isomerase [Myxococcota bacterium]
MSEALSVGADRVVSLRYVLTIDGDEIERGDMEYLHGHHNIVPGLESALEGAALGASLAVDVPPGLAYGDRMDVAPQRVPRTAFPPGVDIHPGMQFGAHGPDGQAIPVWVATVDDDAVWIDVNHPLAGATLHFDVEVLGVRACSAEELEHGHPHGPGGHHHHE